MSISFNDIPSDIRVPLTYVEFDNTRAVTSTPEDPRRAMVLGQRLATGTQAAHAPVRVLSADHAVALFGQGSMLAAMFAALKKADSYTETWAIALDDDAAGQKATGTVTLSGTANVSGTLNLYVGGARVRIAVVAGDALAALATRLAAAINANADLPMLAAAVGSVVTLTCKWAGETGNDIDLRLNYYAEDTPKGLTVALAQPSGGTANPELDDALAALGDQWWHAVISPYTDGASRTAIEDELAKRWGPLKQAEGFCYTAFRGTHGESGAHGESANTQLTTCMGTGPSPTPPYIWAAVNGIVATASLGIDPARPLQTLVLPGILPPALKDRWTMEERNLLLHDGISTYMVLASGQVAIERQITMYRANSYGMPDPSYLDICTPATLGYFRYAVRSRITQRFPRHKLASDGTRYGAGQAIVTPSVIRAELLGLFRELEERGLVEDFEAFKDGLIVERNASDRNRVDVLCTPDLVNQFNVFAACVQFIL